MNDASDSVPHASFYDAYWRRWRWRPLQAAKNLKLHAFDRLVTRLAPSGGSVLDVGCGAGDLALRLARRYDVSAFDFSPVTIDRIARRHPNVRFFVGDAADDPPASEAGRYDVVTCMDVIEHLPFDRQPKLIENLAGYLKPGGLLVISTPDREQALRYKRDASESDEEFLKRYEGQPCADCLMADQLDGLLSPWFVIEHRAAVAPVVLWRPADLAWKVLALATAYRGVNWLTGRLGMPHRYLIRAARRRRT